MSRRRAALGARYPRGIESRYRGEIRRRVRSFHSVIESRLAATLAVVGDDIDDRARRLDSVASDLQQILTVFEVVGAAWGVASPVTLSPLVKTGRQLDLFATATVSANVKRAISLGLPTIPIAQLDIFDPDLDRIGLWARENARLIESLEERHVADLGKAAREVVAGGGSTRDLSFALRARLGVSQRRGDLIARDQVGSLNAQITRARHEEIGVRGYRWSDSEDERVRDTHSERRGKLFLYSEPPDDGHAGEPIGCRCGQIPDFGP